MTLMPVTRIAASVDWSTKAGASAWIGAIMSLPIGPRSSIGSPMTFMMRPSVFGPTGTRICEPVALTVWPRVRPSVESMAIVRTTFSPRCCATSRTRRLPPIVGLERGEDRRQLALERDVDDGADDLATRPTRLLGLRVAAAEPVADVAVGLLGALRGLVSGRRWPCLSSLPSCSVRALRRPR